MKDSVFEQAKKAEEWPDFEGVEEEEEEEEVVTAWEEEEEEGPLERLAPDFLLE
jgi:hypothetical protein